MNDSVIPSRLELDCSSEKKSHFWQRDPRNEIRLATNSLAMSLQVSEVRAVWFSKAPGFEVHHLAIAAVSQLLVELRIDIVGEEVE